MLKAEKQYFCAEFPSGGFFRGLRLLRARGRMGSRVPLRRAPLRRFRPPERRRKTRVGRRTLPQRQSVLRPYDETVSAQQMCNCA